MPPEEIKNLVCAYFKNVDTLNTGGWLESFAKDAVVYDPVGKPPVNVHEDAEKFFAILSSIFEKLDVTADKIFVVENSAAVQWTMRGVGKNGKLGTTEGISIFEIDEAGKIKKISAYWNEADLMVQLKD